MDQNSQAGSSTQETDWGAMGGTSGDGLFGGAPMGGSPPPQPQYQQPQPQPQYQQQQQQQMAPPQPTTVTPPAGSVSRFAPQQQSSYAARAAAANAMYQANSPGPPSVQTTPAPAGGGSFAARSAAAHASYQPQPNSSMSSTSPYNNNNSAGGGGGSYAQRSVQAHSMSGGGGYGTSPSPSYQQQQQQPSPGYQPQQSSPAYSGTSQGGGGGGGGAPYGNQYQPMPPQQQQQANAYHQQPPMQSSPNRAPPPASNQGSYASRAAQAYGNQQQQPQQQQQPYVGSPGYNQQYGSQSVVGGQSVVTNATGMPSPQQQQPQQQRPGMPSGNMPINNNNMGGGGTPASMSPQIQQRLLADVTRKVQEHAYYMKQAMEQQLLPTVLERAAYMVGELGGLPHGAQAANAAATGGVSLSNTGLSAQLTPKNYYELYMRALEEMPALEEYLLGLTQKLSPPEQPDQIQIVMEAGGPAEPNFKMRELYDCAQYCPRVLPRLYLQIAAGSALLRSGEIGAKWMLNDLLQAVKCEQNPIRGLFLRNYLLTALRDKLPDGALPSSTAVAGADDVNNNNNESSAPENTSEGAEAEDSSATEKPSVAATTVTDPEQDPGNVIDSYEFVVANFMEMNKLWVRLQHMPGDRSKEVKKRRERERNDLRILVGTNLVRLSQLEGVTSKIYGESILPRILEHIVIEGDPLSQAYLMDCLVQVFPDEYHIETMPILLAVCPRLRDKVNIRTILQGLMSRLANYLAEEELLDESDTNQVKLTLARDSFGMFEDCVQKVYNARGPKLTAKEVIRLQTALLQFSIKCYPGNLEQITSCMSACVSALDQANASYEMTEATMVNVPPKQLDDVAVAELEKLMSIPLESLALKVLQLEHYAQLITFLPWNNRRGVAIKLLEAVDQAGSPPDSIGEIQQLFQLIEPLLRDEGNRPPSSVSINPSAEATSLMAGLGVPTAPAPAFESSFIEDGGTPVEQVEKEAALVSKLIHLLGHKNTDVLYEMLVVARRGVQVGGRRRMARVLSSLVIAGLKLTQRVAKLEEDKSKIDNRAEPSSEEAEEKSGEEEEEEVESKAPESDSPEDAVPEEESKPETPEKANENDSEIVPGEESKTVPEDEAPHEIKISCRQLFIFVQETIRNLGKANAEAGVKMYLEAATVADSLAQKGSRTTYSPISYEMLSQAYSLYEESISDSKVQQKCVTAMIGTLMLCGGLTESDYESLITKSAQLSAKLVKKPDQCRMVALCAHLFYPASKGEGFGYRNAQRSLECLQRSLKLADSCTSANPSNVGLFVELLEHYLYLFEKKSPTISAAYITGLVSLIREHLNSLSGSPGVAEAKKHFAGVIHDIKRKKASEETASLFEAVDVGSIGG